ncbi:hypothetical protein [Bacillus bombysepticus]|uniref:hypothetical protein n=1 Tax=Bacillus bombysepticus TaxID=658666 RepID=UPI00301871D6
MKRDQAYYLREMMSKEKNNSTLHVAVWKGEAIEINDWSFLREVLPQNYGTFGENAEYHCDYNWANGEIDDRERFIKALEETEEQDCIAVLLEGTTALNFNLFNVSTRKLCVVRPTISSLEEVSSWIKMLGNSDVEIIVQVPSVIDFETCTGLCESALEYIQTRSGQEINLLGGFSEQEPTRFKKNDNISKRKGIFMENEDRRNGMFVQTVREHVLD